MVTEIKHLALGVSGVFRHLHSSRDGMIDRQTDIIFLYSFQMMYVNFGHAIFLNYDQKKN